jgi:dihydropteroate synthase
MKIIRWGSHDLDFSIRSRIMGIVNVTPDSFSDGGDYFSLDAAVNQGAKLAQAGADVLDIGGESTRPFAETVPLQEELRRVIPVIEKLSARLTIPISIDTTKAEVARQALEAGAAIINDISALRMDPGMAALAARYRVPVILMHMKGTPRTMQKDPTYRDLMGELISFFEQRINAAMSAGIAREHIIIDPGIGFAKTLEHNLHILRHLIRFASLDCPLLIGTSRKRFVRTLVCVPDKPPHAPEVETGTQATVAAAVLNGAHMVRVHNVADTVSTLNIIDAIKKG